MKAKKITAVIVTLCTMLGGISANAATSTLNGTEIGHYKVTAEQGDTVWTKDANNRLAVKDGKLVMERIASGGSTGDSKYIAVLKDFVAKDAYKVTAKGLKKTFNNNNATGIAFNVKDSDKNGYYACIKNDGLYMYRYDTTKLVATCPVTKEGVDLNSDYVDMEIYVMPNELVYNKNGNKGGRIVVYYTVRDDENPMEVLIPRSLAFDYIENEALLNPVDDKQIGWYSHIRVTATLDELIVEDLPYQMIDSEIKKSDDTVVRSTNELTAGETVSITSRIINENGPLPTGIFAFYGPESFLNMSFAEAVKNSETLNTYTVNNFVVPEGVTSIDALFWDSIENMKPYMNKQGMLKSKTVTAAVNISVE